MKHTVTNVYSKPYFELGIDFVTDDIGTLGITAWDRNETNMPGYRNQRMHIELSIEQTTRLKEFLAVSNGPPF